MAFTIPNWTGTIEYPVASGLYPQSWWQSVDIDILQAQGAGQGVSSGCAVTQRGAGANQSVDVASGTVVINNVEVVVTSGNVAAAAAHATLPRFDLVVVNSSATKSISAGTAASTPLFPAIPANSAVLAAVFRRPTDNTIETAEIVDKRATVSSPAAVGGWTTLDLATDMSIVSTTTMADITGLPFAMVANGEYRIRGVVYFSLPANNGGLKLGTAGPASPAFVLTHWRMPNAVSGLESDNERDDAYDATWAPEVAGASAKQNLVYFEGTVHNGANAGNFSLQAAQQTSDPDATLIKAATYLEYARAD